MPLITRDLLRGLASLNGHSYRILDGEHQLKPKGTPWEADTTYYTDDIDDAFTTLIDMVYRSGHTFATNQREALTPQARAYIESWEVPACPHA